MTTQVKSSSSDVRVALIQLECSTSEPVYERVPRAIGLIGQAAQQADMVMLPELWHVGAFDVEAAREHAQPVDGPLVSELQVTARQYGIWLHGGSFCERDAQGRHFNTSVLFAPDGTLVSSYRKIHLFGFQGGETTLMTSGDELVVVDTPLGPTGLATCYDLRFPEMFRALVAGGATSLLLTSGWPTPRIGHWDVLLQARAIEDQLWVAACNQVGKQPGIDLGGHSCVIDPRGTVVAKAGTRPEILVANIDPAESLRWRETFPVLDDIRLT
ncbi:MAG: carbon-nitrogen family hydrolase [Actinomycetales bacterium]|nr:carbon-nitrogen family hydrolase [Actinomycetales bacterium]